MKVRRYEVPPAEMVGELLQRGEVGLLRPDWAVAGQTRGAQIIDAEHVRNVDAEQNGELLELLDRVSTGSTTSGRVGLGLKAMLALKKRRSRRAADSQRSGLSIPHMRHSPEYILRQQWISLWGESESAGPATTSEVAFLLST